VDADFDGLPDFVDNCPQSPVGAAIDEVGCPIDSDADGVPDGLDDCPNTLYGMDVDRFGCIDLSMLDKPMVLNIDYAPGSFEIDPIRKEMLDGLARVLNFVSDIKLEISGYTDNIGTSTANQNLSEKRANRVRDYLANLGVASERITVYGRGETNFVADNQTSEGRAKNRRIEITFYR
jgi:outer membrane protein OmpA-like peptidoglycan-associated protein